jgi:hypothetical protein
MDPVSRVRGKKTKAQENGNEDGGKRRISKCEEKEKIESGKRVL